jgi:hypothetical protein
MKDDVLPVEQPYTDIMASSTSLSGTPVSPVENPMYIFSSHATLVKAIFIPILAINRSRELWGPNAHEFKYVSLRLVAYLVSRVPPRTVGKAFRRPSRRSHAFVATYRPSSAAPEHASDTGSLSSSESNSRLKCPSVRRRARPELSHVEHRMKVFLFTLVRVFEFELAFTVSEISKC